MSRRSNQSEGCGVGDFGGWISADRFEDIGHEPERRVMAFHQAGPSWDVRRTSRLRDDNRHVSRRQLVRYGLVGVAGNAASYLLYFVATGLGANPVATITVLYPLQVLASFFLNRAWSFEYQGRVRGSMARYLAAYVVCYFLNVAILAVFVQTLGLSHLAVQAAAIVFLASLLFLAQKYWVFRRPQTIHEESVEVYGIPRHDRQ